MLRGLGGIEVDVQRGDNLRPRVYGGGSLLGTSCCGLGLAM